MDSIMTGTQSGEERELSGILEELRRNEYESTAENTEEDFEDEVMQPIDWDTIANQYKDKQ
jgi:hypothetical protein